jgi:uncharacterized protein YlzI (FlbEa/FlbD family)
MSNFKQLTRQDGTKVWANLDHVTMIIAAPEGSVIWIVGEDSDIRVKESPHEIVGPGS